MALLLGVDTGGTYTDAVLVDQDRDHVIAKAKALTSRPDLSIGISEAIDNVLQNAAVSGADIGMVSLSTTLATNALVEGQGGRVALIFVGFEPSELERDGLSEALGDDPVIFASGGHDHAGGEVSPLGIEKARTELRALGHDITGVAIASRFATRNPTHETAMRDMVRRETGLPVTCSHELSAALGGPKRALTAVLNARLVGMIDRLIGACEAHLKSRGIAARLMVVRGDGALVSADWAREKPIETILSGPAASIAGAAWLTGETDAIVSDIGGTTTDVCLLRDGMPQIDPQGARVGRFRTMVEAVAMRTTGLGGDSEVHVVDGLERGLRLGPRRLIPVSLLAVSHPDLVHRVLDRALRSEAPMEGLGRFVVPLWSDLPPGLDAREAAIADRLQAGPITVSDAVVTRVEGPALTRLVARGLVIVSGVTPSDASHVLKQAQMWDSDAAEKALTLMARKRIGSGDRLAESAEALAHQIIAQVTRQTADCILEAAFAEDQLGGVDVAAHQLVGHPLAEAGLRNHSGVVRMSLSLGVPVVGLGASARTYYGAVGEFLNGHMILPTDADVANAIGAVVGQVSVRQTGIVSSGGAGVFVVHGADGPVSHSTQSKAIAALTARLEQDARRQAQASGVDEIQIISDVTVREAEIEGQPMFVEAEVSVTAMGRPRIALG